MLHPDLVADLIEQLGWRSLRCSFNVHNFTLLCQVVKNKQGVKLEYRTDATLLQYRIYTEIGVYITLGIAMFSLRFPENDIKHWAERNTSQDYLVFQNEIGPSAQKRGYMTRPEFLKMCEWKSPRTKSRCAKNSSDFIKEITQVSFTAQHEQLRIQVLTLLFGVGWPTASVILHFCSSSQYPILDFRALWSLKAEQPAAYDFPFWWSYTEHCRALAKRNSVSMRTIDRALWQYSKVNQNA